MYAHIKDPPMGVDHLINLDNVMMIKRKDGTSNWYDVTLSSGYRVSGEIGTVLYPSLVDWLVVPEATAT